jgi:protein involved in ribonucleotide reduction
VYKYVIVKPIINDGTTIPIRNHDGTVSSPVKKFSAKTATKKKIAAIICANLSCHKYVLI